MTKSVRIVWPDGTSVYYGVGRPTTACGPVVTSIVVGRDNVTITFDDESLKIYRGVASEETLVDTTAGP